jgi:hypothetical protein
LLRQPHHSSSLITSHALTASIRQQTSAHPFSSLRSLNTTEYGRNLCTQKGSQVHTFYRLFFLHQATALMMLPDLVVTGSPPLPNSQGEDQAKRPNPNVLVPISLRGNVYSGPTHSPKSAFHRKPETPNHTQSRNP